MGRRERGEIKTLSIFQHSRARVDKARNEEEKSDREVVLSSPNLISIGINLTQKFSLHLPGEGSSESAPEPTDEKSFFASRKLSGASIKNEAKSS